MTSQAVRTSVSIMLTIRADGDGHVDSGAVLCAIERLLESGLVVGPEQRIYAAKVSETLALHTRHEHG